MRGASLAVALLSSTLLVSPAAADGIETRVEDGRTVFVSRPDRKPGAAETAPIRSTTTRQKAPPEILRLVEEVSLRYDLDPRLITTVISVESNFDHLAVSPKGARGLMQLMPGTARQYGVSNVHDPRENLEGGVAYLRDLTRRYNGNMRLALAAYNAGPEAVERASGVPNYTETKEYLRRIEARYGQSLTLSGMGPLGGTVDHRQGGRIEVTRDEEGRIVVTNRRSAGVTIVPRPARR